MKKGLGKVILIFLSLFVLFSAAVLITEAVNNKNIMNTYPKASQVTTSSAVQIALPSKDAFDFQHSRVITWLVGLFMSFTVPAFFLFSGLSVSIRNWAARRTRRWALVIIIYFLIYSLLETIIFLPLDIYTGFIRLHQYGLSNQTFTQWLLEDAKSFLVNAAMTAAIIWIPYMIMRRSKKRWWLYISLASVPYLFFMLYMQPVVIDPIFNSYKPVENKVLYAKIEDLLSRTTIGSCDIYEVDKSKETNQMNAYMTGVFNTKRIVLWDTTIKNLNTDEVLCVTAHEMGHYLMGHVWKSIFAGSFGCIFLLYFIYRISDSVLKRTKGRLGFNKIYDAAAFPLIILLINLMVFVSAPVSNAYSRHLEAEADRFEIELTKNNYASATSTVKLHQQSLVLPEPGLVYILWNYDHPTFKSRVDFANNYRPWESNQPLKYQRFIRESKK